MANLIPMNCPACGSPQEALKIEGVELDQCRRCRGIWFDHMEIDQILAMPRLPERLISQQLYHDPPLMRPEGERPCPRCRELLKTINVDGISLDACSLCKGFFADLGEVGALTQAAEKRFESSQREASRE
jgi:Zn-finger nucleic acid-binding protein